MDALKPIRIFTHVACEHPGYLCEYLERRGVCYEKIHIGQDEPIPKQIDDVSSMIVLGHAHPTDDHDDFFKPFVKLADKFDKPVLYLHGDGHSWEHKKGWKKKNLIRVQVDQGIKGPPVLVTVKSGGKQPFDFDRRGAGKKKD